MAFVDTLSVLRDRATWRQSDEELNVPPQPKAFKLGGETPGIFEVGLAVKRAPLQARDVELALLLVQTKHPYLFDCRRLERLTAS